MSASSFKQLNKSQASVAALKNLMLERIDNEKKMEMEAFKLQIKTQNKNRMLEKKLKEIIEGKEILPEDCSRFLSLVPLDTQVEDFVGTPPISSNVFGLKNFWFTALSNFGPTSKLIHKHDLAILNCLTDIRGIKISPEHLIPEYPDFKDLGFVLEFHFSKNNYFSNAVLFKYYRLGYPESDLNPLQYSDLIPLDVVLSPIDWFPGRNFTVKHLQKSLKYLQTGQVRVVRQTLKIGSFFHIFSRPQGIELKKMNQEELKLHLKALLKTDYELAMDIMVELIPNSVLYYMEECTYVEDSFDDDSQSHNDGSLDDGTYSASNFDSDLKKSKNENQFGQKECISDCS